MLVFNLLIGLCFFFVGVVLFIICVIVKIKLENIIKLLFLFYVVMFVVLMFIIYVDWFSEVFLRVLGF